MQKLFSHKEIANCGKSKEIENTFSKKFSIKNIIRKEIFFRLFLFLLVIALIYQFTKFQTPINQFQFFWKKN